MQIKLKKVTQGPLLAKGGPNVPPPPPTTCMISGPGCPNSSPVPAPAPTCSC